LGPRQPIPRRSQAWPPCCVRLRWWPDLFRRIAPHASTPWLLSAAI